MFIEENKIVVGDLEDLQELLEDLQEHGEIKVSLCGHVGSPEKSFKGICNCPGECTSGYSLSLERGLSIEIEPQE